MTELGEYHRRLGCPRQQRGEALELALPFSGRPRGVHDDLQLRRFVDEYGMTHLICRLFFPGMPHSHIMRGLELLAGEVAPAFR